MLLTLLQSPEPGISGSKFRLLEPRPEIDLELDDDEAIALALVLLLAA